MSLPTLPDSVSDALIVRPVSQLLIPSEVKLDCELSYKTIFNWTVFKINSMQEGNELVLNRKGSSELLIRGRTLGAGSYMVILTVSMRGTKVYGVNKGYFRIERSPLIALISGGTRVERGFNKTLEFDASFSGDPDAVLPNAGKFAFTLPLSPTTAMVYTSVTPILSDSVLQQRLTFFVKERKIQSKIAPAATTSNQLYKKAAWPSDQCRS